MIHHEMVRASNPRWLLNLLQQLLVGAAPERVAHSRVGPAPVGGGAEALRMDELRALVQLSVHWNQRAQCLQGCPCDL